MTKLRVLKIKPETWSAYISKKNSGKKKKKKDKESWKKFVIISNAEGKHQFTKCCTRSKLVDIMQHSINTSINCIEMKRKEIK